MEVPDTIVEPLKIAYRYAAGDQDITLEEMQSRVADALCEAIGDEAFQRFNSELPDF